jgi:protein involved in polysaccharide export with SLBB domain
MHVIRGGRILAADFERALERPDHRSNIELTAGDTVHVPAFDPTVVVAGAVNFESRVVYVPGRSIDYYINQAGGFLDSADRRRTTISYPNGERSAIRSSLVSGRPSEVRPGSQIYVPARPEGHAGTNWDQIITRSVGMLTGLATLLLAVQGLR